jgi:hypothetical protein
MPLEERGEPLAPNAATAAENGEVALVTTAQLYEALRREQEGELDTDGFWTAIFEASGVASLPEPDPPLRQST